MAVPEPAPVQAGQLPGRLPVRMAAGSRGCGGWKAAGEYGSRSGGAVQPGELIAGLPEMYGTAPAGRLPDSAIHAI